MNIEIRNDEPTTNDTLDRGKFAEALAQVIKTCDTPLVIGLYGTWGVGKTSLMQQIKSKIDEVNIVRSVWFDPWQHQFDEDPAISLLHTMVDGFNMGEDGKKLLTVIAGALGSILLKATTTLSTTEIQELAEKYEKERFLVREKQIRLRQHFSQLIEKASDKGAKRLVFFIDDLDRCIPEQILKVLEALKLYLNLPGCVYILGVDRGALEGSIKHRYKDLDLNEASYLDKIVQLPFSIPPIAENSMGEFVTPLVPQDLHDVVPMLIRGLGGNPRQVKRFINTFLLNHQLASTMLGEAYSPKFLVAVLLIQYRQPEFFKVVVRDSTALNKIASGEKSEYSEQIKDDQTLLSVIMDTGLNTNIDVTPYIYLSEVASVRKLEFDIVMHKVGNRKIQLIKEVRQHTGLGLKDSKDLVESKTPVTLSSGLSKDEAEVFKSALEAAGAEVEII